jgi:ribose 5-phosphate isomerase A
LQHGSKREAPFRGRLFRISHYPPAVSILAPSIDWDFNRRGRVAPTGNQADELKQAAAVRAADWVESGMTVGLGTGSTIRFLLEELALRMRLDRLERIRGVPTSEDTARRSVALGIPLISLEEAGELDLTIDGADEVDSELRLIKGLGGALLREKIVAAASRRLVIVVDESKMVERLGTRAPLPVEVEPFGRRVHESFFRELGADPVLRVQDDNLPFRTDGGHFIYDCSFEAGINDPEELERRLDTRPGIIESGLFLGMANHIVIARSEGLQVMNRTEGARS